MTSSIPTPIYRCELCRFWLRYDDGSRGLCRRYPPAVLLKNIDGDFTLTEFPVMFPNGWCGEYKVRGPKR